MMLSLVDVADMLANECIAERESIYCGKMGSKDVHLIGVYNLERNQPKRETIGGDENSSYRVKQISFLVHWDTSLKNTEEAAEALYEAVKKIKNVTVNGKRIYFTKMLVDEPVDVGMDDDYIHERVIEAEFYYER